MGAYQRPILGRRAYLGAFCARGPEVLAQCRHVDS